MGQGQLRYIAGVDEAGRGPLAGPVAAAAVILDPRNPIIGLADSKKLSEKRREALFDEIQARSLAFAIATADAAEVDELNILQATLLAMKRAVESLSLLPDQVLIDGTHSPDLICEVETVIKGDQKVEEIMAASILAKVTRDREMRQWHETYPNYGFAQHKGYGTKQHMEALRQFGPCPIHRNSFAPVRRSSL